ncbi:unnamed protein product, partial [Closterium sp. NIES-65]
MLGQSNDPTVGASPYRSAASFYGATGNPSASAGPLIGAAGGAGAGSASVSASPSVAERRAEIVAHHLRVAASLASAVSAIDGSAGSAGSDDPPPLDLESATVRAEGQFPPGEIGGDLRVTVTNETGMNGAFKSETEAEAAERTDWDRSTEGDGRPDEVGGSDPKRTENKRIDSRRGNSGGGGGVGGGSGSGSGGQRRSGGSGDADAGETSRQNEGGRPPRSPEDGSGSRGRKKGSAKRYPVRRQLFSAGGRRAGAATGGNGGGDGAGGAGERGGRGARGSSAGQGEEWRAPQPWGRAGRAVRSVLRTWGWDTLFWRHEEQGQLLGGGRASGESGRAEDGAQEEEGGGGEGGGEGSGAGAGERGRQYPQGAQGDPLESLDYDVIDNSVYREEQSSHTRTYTPSTSLFPLRPSPLLPAVFVSVVFCARSFSPPARMTFEAPLLRCLKSRPSFSLLFSSPLSSVHVPSLLLPARMLATSLSVLATPPFSSSLPCYTSSSPNPLPRPPHPARRGKLHQMGYLIVKWVFALCLGIAFLPSHRLSCSPMLSPAALCRVHLHEPLASHAMPTSLPCPLHSTHPHSHGSGSLLHQPTGLAAFSINVAVEILAGWKFGATWWVMQRSHALAFVVYLAFNVLLVFSSSFIVTRFAPAAAGSGIPEIKGYLNGSVGWLRMWVVGCLATYPHGYVWWVMQRSHALAFMVYLAFNVLLVFSSSFIVTRFAPAAAGSGIPEIKGYLNGSVGWLRMWVVGCLATYPHGYVWWVMQRSHALAFMVYLAFNVLLVFSSSFIVTRFAPAAAGSGIPEIKGYLNGSVGWLRMWVVGCLATYPHGYVWWVMQRSHALAFMVYLAFNVLLVFSSSFIVTRFAPAAAGSGIPEIKGYLNGSVGWLRMWVVGCLATYPHGYVWWVMQRWHALAFMVYLAFNVLLVFSSSFIVTRFAPAAAGSGIPEIKGYLNGIDMPGILLVRTLVGKMLGSVGSVAGGLALGKEGPLVHTGACLAALIGQGGSSRYRIPFKWFRAFRNDRDRRDMVTCGAAAGAAAAFRAPVGGVLFALEEVTSWWRPQLMWRVFFTSAVVAVVLKACMRWCASGEGASEFFSYQLLPMTMLGLMGGLLGALFNQLTLYLSAWRRNYLHKRGDRVKIIEACLVAAATSALSFTIPFLAPCRACPDPMRYPDIVCPRPKYHWGNFVQFNCPRDDQYNDLATIFFNTQDDAIRNLFSSGTIQEYSATTLISFLLIFFCLAVLTYGIAVPSGQFVPGIMIGATYGRLVGMLMVHMYGQDNTDEGTYALLGAASFLGGSMRMTVSLCVIMVEITNNLNLLPLIMLVLLVSKAVGDGLNAGFYDLHAQLRGIPILEAQSQRFMRMLSARDAASTKVVYFARVEMVGRIAEVLRSTSHNGYPVLQDLPDGHTALAGLILRSQLLVLLRSKADFQQSPTERMHPLQTSSLRSLGSYSFSDFAKPVSTKGITIGDIELSREDLTLWIDLGPFLNPTPFIVDENMSLTKVHTLFRQLGLRHLCVVPPPSRAVGIITRKDLLPE